MIRQFEIKLSVTFDRNMIWTLFWCQNVPWILNNKLNWKCQFWFLPQRAWLARIGSHMSSKCNVMLKICLYYMLEINILCYPYIYYVLEILDFMSKICLFILYAWNHDFMLTMLLGHAYMYTMHCLIYVDHVDFIMSLQSWFYFDHAISHDMLIFTIGDVNAGKDSGGGVQGGRR